jgi:hypothetical protein
MIFPAPEPTRIKCGAGFRDHALISTARPTTFNMAAAGHHVFRDARSDEKSAIKRGAFFGRRKVIRCSRGEASLMEGCCRLRLM